MDQPVESYPVNFWVDYPEEPLDRLSTFFRIIAVIPIYIVGRFFSYIRSGPVGIGTVRFQPVSNMVVNGWNTCICTVTYDLISAKVPQVVVRLERGIAQISVPSDLLFIVAAGRIPFHRRGVGCQHRGGVPRRTSGAEQVAAPGKVVAGHPPLCGAHHIMGRSICSPHHRLVCYPLHGALSCPTVWHM